MRSISKEEYLRIIAAAESDGEQMVAGSLAESLSVAPPVAAGALKRLVRNGLVRIARDGRLQLTSQGREIAERTISRQYLVERMLSEIFGMPWHAIHDEATRLERAISPSFEKRLLEKLGRSDICPHGNGLALRSAAQRRKHGLCLLSEGEAASRYRIASVYERDRRLLEFFDKEGLRPGADVDLRSHNYDGTVTVVIRSAPVRLGLPAAEKVWVKKA